MRDAAFDRADLMSVDNSYIVITNAANFQDTDLNVLKEMVILPAEDGSNEASFEAGEDFYADGELTQVSATSTLHPPAPASKVTD